MTTKPLIAITMGDPAGIGPEINAKVFKSGEVLLRCQSPFVVGNADVIKKVVADLKLALDVRTIGAAVRSDPAAGRLEVLHQDNVGMGKHAWGRPSTASGKAVVDYITLATRRLHATSGRRHPSAWRDPSHSL